MIIDNNDSNDGEMNYLFDEGQLKNAGKKLEMNDNNQ